MHWTAIAGGVATALFVLSTLPMVIKARRSRDLHSYSGANLVIANCGNLFQSVYVITLPPGPIWGIHLFNTVVSALMLHWWVRFGRARSTSDAPATRICARELVMTRVEECHLRDRPAAVDDR